MGWSSTRSAIWDFDLSIAADTIDWVRDEAEIGEQILISAWHSLRTLPLAFLGDDDANTLHCLRLGITVAVSAYFPPTAFDLKFADKNPPNSGSEFPFKDAYRSLKSALKVPTSDQFARDCELSLADGFDVLAASERYSHKKLERNGLIHYLEINKDVLFKDIIRKIEHEFSLIGKLPHGDWFNEPLWPDGYEHASEHGGKFNQAFFEAFDVFAVREAMQPDVWGFWLEWYEGLLNGQPMDWELQRYVASIPDSDWEQDPVHVAKRIEEVRARFELERQIAKLKEQIADSALLATPSSRHHNHPPEPIEDAPEFKKEVMLLKARLDDLEQETAEDEPSPSKLTELASWFSDQLTRLCGFGLDLSSTFLKEGAKKAGALGGTALVAHLSSPEGLPALIQSILKYASILPPG